jgi:hypothetical protein
MALLSESFAVGLTLLGGSAAPLHALRTYFRRVIDP